MKTELVKFYASDGLTLHGLLFRSGKKTKNVIIDVFGMTGDFFGMNHLQEFVNLARKSKFDIFFAGNRGLGVVFRFDKKGSKKSFYSGTAKERFEDCTHDIKGAVRAMKLLRYSNIVLQGQSTGCQKITYYQYKTRDKNVKALVLMAPADDYNLARKTLGKKFSKAVKIAKQMVRNGRGDELIPSWISKYTAKRFLSFADPKNAEAQLFNYDGDLKMFSKITVPILAIFGSKEQYALKPVRKYMRILESKTNSKKFAWKIIKGGNHTCEGKEAELARTVIKWLASLKL